jgi:hypothetical protein
MVGIRAARACRISGWRVLRGKRSERHVGHNRSGSNCSLVAWILGLSRFQQRNSRAAGNRYRDAPRTLLQA